jgi:hypothetical protein
VPEAIRQMVRVCKALAERHQVVGRLKTARLLVVMHSRALECMTIV